MTQFTSPASQCSRSEAICIDIPFFSQSKCSSKRVGLTRTSRCPPFWQYSSSSRRTTRWRITTYTSERHTLSGQWTFLTTAISSNVKAEVGGGIVTSGLFFHGTDRACTLGDTRVKDVLCNKKECSLCMVIRHSFDIERTGVWLPGLVLISDLVIDIILVGTKHRFSRFGPGIYTSACSSSNIVFPLRFPTIL